MGNLFTAYVQKARGIDEKDCGCDCACMCGLVRMLRGNKPLDAVSLAGHPRQDDPQWSGVAMLDLSDEDFLVFMEILGVYAMTLLQEARLEEEEAQRTKKPKKKKDAKYYEELRQKYGHKK